MHLRMIAVMALTAAVVVPALADDDMARALSVIKAVKKEGRGNDDAGAAWKTLVGKGTAALFPTLEAFDDANPTATNWLRTAVDAIVEAEAAAGRKLPADKLEAFCTNAKFAPSARRHAYELLVEIDADAKARLLPGFLNDKSAELRRDAIAHQLEIIERLARPTVKADLEKLFEQSRDRDQVQLLAKKVAANGGKVSITEHFAFVNHASLIGPFDAPESRGFEIAHPPETATAATGKFKGKDGAELTWKPAATADLYGTFDLNTLLGKHKNSVAYALAVIVAPKDMPCEVRVTSPTSVKIFLNGKLVHGHDEYHHGAPFDGIVGKGALRKGDNVIVLKISQNNQTEAWAQAWQFQMRVCDDTGGALPLEQKITTDGNVKLIPLGFNPNPTEEKKEKK